MPTGRRHDGDHGFGGRAAAMGWQARAACQDSDPGLFFPKGARTMTESVARAKRICASCPVRRQCLDWALKHREETGVWGGRTEQERRAGQV